MTRMNSGVNTDSFHKPPAISMAGAVRGEPDGPILPWERVNSVDLGDVMSEVWRELFLRQGRPHVPLADLPVTLTPFYEDASRSSCSGFAVETERCDPPVRRREFSRRSLGPVARRAVQRLREAGGLPEGGTVHYELVAECAENTAVRSTPQEPAFTASNFLSVFHRRRNPFPVSRSL